MVQLHLTLRCIRNCIPAFILVCLDLAFKVGNMRKAVALAKRRGDAHSNILVVFLVWAIHK